MSKALPLISVIVPTYNNPEMFDALRSVLAQDYPRMQLIVTDDASDNFPQQEIDQFISSSACENLESFSVLAHGEHMGTVRNLNRAIELCRGEYIFCLAGDDSFYDDRVLSDWVNAFIQSGAQIITARRAVYDEQLCHFSHTEPTREQIRKIQTLSTKALFEELAATNFIFGCCTARTAQSIRKYGAFDESYTLIEDHPMNLRLLRMGEPIVYYDRIVVKHRSGGISSPKHYNAAYELDVDRVLHQDVLPYSAHPMIARWRHFLWKRDQRLCKRRAELMAQHGTSKIMYWLIQIWYYSHHPLRTLCRIPRRVRKWIAKGEV